MRLSTILQVRNLLARLHPLRSGPPRESQTLSALLKNSFNQRLDETHPPVRDRESAAGTTSREPYHASSTSLSAQATENHLQSLLSHPLLQQASPHVSSSVNQELLTRWDRTLVSDQLDIEAVTQSLYEYQKKLFQEKRPIATSLCHRLIAWFSTSSTDVQEQALTDKGLVNLMVPLLYHAKSENTAWDWLRLLYSGELSRGNPNSQFDMRSALWLNNEDRFVAAMVRESLRRNDLETAAKEFVEACVYRSQSGRASTSWEESREHGSLPYQPLSWTWKPLSSAILTKAQSHGISSSLYDQLMLFAVPTQVVSWIDHAFLELYHPSRPSTSMLVEKVASPRWTSSFALWKDRCPPRMQKSLVRSILDAAQIELDAGSIPAAKSLLYFAEQQFPTLVSHQKNEVLSQRIDHARSEITIGYPYALQLAAG